MLSSTSPARAFRILTVVVPALVALALAPSAFGIGQINTKQDGLRDLDARAGSVAPTSAQRTIVSQLGASATWNRFGTPASLIKYGGYLATGLGSDPVTAARTFVGQN